MTLAQKFLAGGLVAAAAFAWLGLGGAAAEAKQTSLDHRIFETFKQIDGRTNDHEQAAARMRASLEGIAGEIETLNEELAGLSTDPGDGDSLRKRREVHGRLVHLSAQYLNQAYKLVDSAASVISANLSDLAKIADEVRRTGDPFGGPQELGRRIERNVAAGRSMRGALVELRRWVHEDPQLVGQFQSLKRMMVALDRKIGIDKARLGARAQNVDGSVRHQRIEALDRTVDRLSDMYAEVVQEKEMLVDLRDEVAVAIQLGRLEITREVAERAIPGLGRPRTVESGLGSLAGVARSISGLNDALIEDDLNGASPGASSGAPAGGLVIDGFTNF